MTDISGNADNRAKRAIRAAKADPFANRVFIRPDAVGRRLTDQYYRRRVRPVLFGELPTGKQRNSHRAEIAGADDIPLGARRFLGIGQRFSST